MNLRTRRDDQGVSVITAILVGMVLTGLALAALQASFSELGRSQEATDRSASFQAAEAGVDDYLAKLTEDHVYYAHHVHPGETTRKDGTYVRTAGQTWAGTLNWTYAGQTRAWRSLGNGHEFNLQITPPSAGNVAVRIVSTGRENGSNEGWRSIEVLVRSASVADFQMIANEDISYGDTATTRGKLYAGVDQSGDRKNINHDGQAFADLYAEGNITVDGDTYRNGAWGFTRTSNPSIRTAIKNPINFNNFTISLVDIKRAAQSPGGIYLPSTAGVHGWRLRFTNDGNVTVAGCTRNGTHLADQSVNCATTVSGVTGIRAVPAIGAIFSEQPVIVSGPTTALASIVQGRVTVAANDDIIIGGNISYETPGTDVLGLIARDEMIVAEWAPDDLTWSAATIAQEGQWRSWNSNQSHDTMTFTGSTATNGGGYMGMFATRNYNYDPNLIFLQPPYFPVLEEAYTVLFFRELPT